MDRWAECTLAELDFGSEPSPRRQASAGLLHRKGRVLLQFRGPDVEVAPNVWDAPGGHIEKKESPEEALARELEEELGIEVRRAALLLVRDLHEEDRSRLNRSFLYLVSAWEGEVESREGGRVEWFRPAEALALKDLRPITRMAIEQCNAHGWWREGAASAS